MFDTLFNWFQSAWDWIVGLFQNIWDWCRPSFVWVMTTFVAVVSITNQVVQFVWDGLQKIVTLVSQLAIQGQDQSANAAVDWLNRANTFFPIHEGLSLMTALTILWGVAITYRLVKSWLPTLS